MSLTICRDGIPVAVDLDDAQILPTLHRLFGAGSAANALTHQGYSVHNTTTGELDPGWVEYAANGSSE